MCFRNITDENQPKAAEHVWSINRRYELDLFFCGVEGGQTQWA